MANTLTVAKKLKRNLRTVTFYLGDQILTINGGVYIVACGSCDTCDVNKDRDGKFCGHYITGKEDNICPLKGHVCFIRYYNSI